MRAVLREPPVAGVWNTPEQANPLRKLAVLKDTYTLGLSERLLDSADAVSAALRRVDNAMYDNGNERSPALGRVKDPLEKVQLVVEEIQVAVKVSSGPQIR